MNILIQTNDGVVFEEQIPLFATTLTIKKHLERTCGISASLQTLSFEGEIMVDYCNVEYYNITEGSRIHLNVAPESEHYATTSWNALIDTLPYFSPEPECEPDFWPAETLARPLRELPPAYDPNSNYNVFDSVDVLPDPRPYSRARSRICARARARARALYYEAQAQAQAGAGDQAESGAREGDELGGQSEPVSVPEPEPEPELASGVDRSLDRNR